MTTLFVSAEKLILFQNSVWNHLVDTGMDSIAFIPTQWITPATWQQTLSNLMPASYTVQSAQQLIERQLEVYNKYSKTRKKAACTYLLALLTPLLSNKQQGCWEAGWLWSVPNCLVAILEGYYPAVHVHWAIWGFECCQSNLVFLANGKTLNSLQHSSEMIHSNSPLKFYLGAGATKKKGSMTN